MASAEQSAVRRLGRYAVYGEIAAGGMATVFIGRLLGPVGFARRVAVKSLHPQLAKDPDFVSMFLDEARLVGLISHSNVVPVLDVISLESELHLVMEYVEGEALSRVVRCLKPLGQLVPVTIAVGIMLGVLDGLHAAHDARRDDGTLLSIVHRDVSPQNILVGVDGVAKILDFGIAKAVGRMQTTRGDQLKGKLAYMAPEQLAREPLDRRADVYAASIVLWELLTGERLFHEGDEISTFRKAMELVAPPPSARADRVPAALDAVVLRGLARDRNQRFTTAHEMAAALDATGLAAAPREIGEWLRNVCRDSLAQRAARIEAHERNPLLAALSPEAPSQPAPARSQANEAGADGVTRVLSVDRAPYRLLGLLSVALLAVSLAVALLLLRPRVSSGSASALVASARASESPAALSEPMRTADRIADARPAAPAAEPAPIASGDPGSKVQRPANRPAVKPPGRSTGPIRKANCDAPFTVDAHGVKVPKLECL